MEVVIKRLILILSALLIFCCALLNLKYSSTMEVVGECLEYVETGKNPVVFQCCIAVFIGLFYRILIRSDWFKKVSIHKARIITLVFIFLAGLFWVTHVYVIPGADSGQLINAAHAFSRNDFSLFEMGQYFHQHPHQLGFTLYLQFFNALFGEYEYTKLMIANVVFLVISDFTLMKIMEKIFPSRENQILICFLLLGFLPAIFYCSFIYGVIPGLMLSLIGIRWFMDYLDTHRVSKLIISGVMMGLAYLIKPNYVIFITAVILGLRAMGAL